MDLKKVKLSLRISTNAFDDEISTLIEAAKQDLLIAGIKESALDDSGEKKIDSIIERAIITYVRINFGEPSDYDRLKNSYDEQKSQLGMNSKYTLFKGGA